MKDRLTMAAMRIWWLELKQRNGRKTQSLETIVIEELVEAIHNCGYLGDSTASVGAAEATEATEVVVKRDGVVGAEVA